MKIFVTEGACVEALRESWFNRQKAMMMEFAVVLAAFYDQGGTGKLEKKVIRELYASTGAYDCIKRLGDDYTMVDNRIRAIADLYDKLGRRRVLAWASDKTDVAAIESIAAELDKLQLYTVKDVSMYAMDGKGQPERHREPPEHNRRAEDKEVMFMVETEHLHLAVPPDTTPEELVQAANRLLELAEELRVQAM